MASQSMRAVMIRRPSDPWLGRDDGARLSTPTRDHSRTPARVASCAVRRSRLLLLLAEIMLYGIAQKEQLGFDKAVEECKYRAFVAASNHTTTPLDARPVG